MAAFTYSTYSGVSHTKHQHCKAHSSKVFMSKYLTLQKTQLLKKHIPP